MLKTESELDFLPPPLCLCNIFKFTTHKIAVQLVLSRSSYLADLPSTFYDFSSNPGEGCLKDNDFSNNSSEYWKSHNCGVKEWSFTLPHRIY